jgi:homoserine O-acetyltransferase
MSVAVTTAQTVSLGAPLALESGAILPDPCLAFESYGTLNRARDNGVLLLHGLTSDQHAAGPPLHPKGKPGWWDIAIGPGRPLDTNRLCVISVNALGGGGGSTGPSSTDPATGRPYGLRFPVVTIGDMVQAQRRLIGQLGIDQLFGMVGGCMGGFQVLEWLRQAPECAGRAVVISATPRVSTHTIALWSVMRAALMSDPAWNGGDYYDGPAPDAGVGLLSAIGALFWMSRSTLAKKFGLATPGDSPVRPSLEPQFAIEHFLGAVQSNAAGKLDANVMIYLTRAMDLFDLTRDAPPLAQQFRAVRHPVLLVSYQHDWRYPPEEMAELEEALLQSGSPYRHVTLDNEGGHGAFIFDFGSLAPILAAFMSA